MPWRHEPLGRAGDGVPPTNKALLVAAGVLLAIPIVALLLGDQLCAGDPEAGGVPFFFWYQFLWVFICAGLTYAAHRLVLAARSPGPGYDGPARPIGLTGRRRPSDEPLLIPLAGGGVDWVALTVLIVLFVVVTVLGFMASRFTRATPWTPSTSGASAAASSAPG